MNTEISFRDKDLLVMKLLHYFITKEARCKILWLKSISE